MSFSMRSRETIVAARRRQDPRMTQVNRRNVGPATGVSNSSDPSQCPDPITGSTMTDSTEIFVTGLRNAHAMEHQALSIMKPQVSRIENYPEVAQRLQQHITETEGQI